MTISELVSDVDFLCGTTSASYLAADKFRNINAEYHNVAREIWEAADGWQYDDSNATTLPIAKTTLVHDQKDYSLPSTAQRVHRVEVQNSDGNWIKLKQLDPADIWQAMPEFRSETNVPVYYDLVGRSVQLYPSPHSAYCTLASGIAFYVDRDVTEFATTATTASPGFATAFHRLLSLAASLDFMQDNQTRQHLLLQRERLQRGLTRFYSKRMVERSSAIKPHSKKSWRQYT